MTLLRPRLFAIPTRLATVLLATLLALPTAWAQGPALGREVLPAPAQPGAVALWPDAAATDTEIWHLSSGQMAVRNTTRPTLQPVLPAQAAGPGGRAAVIVAPGGAFRGLAWEAEGLAVARWLAGQGIAAFVLKYRVLPTPASQEAFIAEIAEAVRSTRSGTAAPAALPTPADALADGLAALRLVRAQAATYGIDPRRVGFMGFSAGGRLTQSVMERAGTDGPDFAVLIYAPMGALQFSAPPPPMFALIAQDDFLLRGLAGFPLIDSVRQAGGMLEFHLLAAGGHGFGLGKAGTPSQDWTRLLQRWLGLQGLLPGAQASAAISSHTARLSANQAGRPTQETP